MDSTTFTQYSVSGSIGTGMSQDPISITLTVPSGATDASALALTQAIRNVAWPPGVSCMVSAFKTTQTNVNTVGDLAVSPPVFQ